MYPPTATIIDKDVSINNKSALINNHLQQIKWYKLNVNNETMDECLTFKGGEGCWLFSGIKAWIFVVKIWRIVGIHSVRSTKILKNIQTST